MAPKAAEKSAASAAQSHEGFSSPTHLAFSSFSHITDMPTLTMSVGLREDEKKTEEWVAKIIPMAKIIPGEPIERKIRSAVDLADSDVLEAAMEVPEYVELQERLRNLVASNAKARDECEAMEASIRMLTNKIAIGEAKTQTLEEANDAKIETLHETNSRKAVIEIDVKECTRVNLQLQTQVNGLNREVDKLAAVLPRPGGPAGDRTRPPRPLGPSERSFARARGEKDGEICRRPRTGAGAHTSICDATSVSDLPAGSTRRAGSHSAPSAVPHSARTTPSSDTSCTAAGPGGSSLRERCRVSDLTK